jgi:DNA processing protein
MAESSACSADVIPWLTLTQLPGVGQRRQLDLLQAFGSIEALFAAPPFQLERYLPDNRDAVRAIVDGLDGAARDRALVWLATPRHHLVTWADDDYPRLLREIADPPLALYVVGDRAVLARPQIAIVGSRNCSPAGRENAQLFARTLAHAGLAITSGLALGIDGAAHKGALDGGGVTIAVTGTGLDRVYPARHRDLAHAIAQRGALISEFPLGTSPRPENFPIRNRLISGLSLGTLVVEAALQSGSLITARLALEQGREVFAIPGSIHSPLARGCHALIRQGAKLVETAADVLEELGPLARVALSDAPELTGASGVELSADAALLLECLGYDTLSIDTIIERSGLTADAVSSMLLQLELQGLVAAVAGGRFQRIAGSRDTQST